MPIGRFIQVDSLLETSCNLTANTWFTPAANDVTEPHVQTKHHRQSDSQSPRSAEVTCRLRAIIPTTATPRRHVSSAAASAGGKLIGVETRSRIVPECTGRTVVVQWSCGKSHDRVRIWHGESRNPASSLCNFPLFPPVTSGGERV